MGRINIQVTGSFDCSGQPLSFCAEWGGHAAAIGRAIEWLTKQLPAAIAQDHRLHKGESPPPKAPWGCGYPEVDPETEEGAT